MSRNPRGIGPVHSQGIALIFVMVMLLLSCIVVLSGIRQGWLNEKMVTSASDQQRAFAAAEALLRDAERDIQGLQDDNTTPCQPGTGFVGCRNFQAGDPFFPQNIEDLDLLQSRLKASDTGCLRGICLPATIDTLGPDRWTTQLPRMTAGTGSTSVAAHYGEFTGLDPASAGNALLRWTRQGGSSPTAPRAWYWVEVFWYATAADIVAASGHPWTPDQKHPFVYRITAYVQGMRPGTRVWLRSIYVPRPQNALELQ